MISFTADDINLESRRARPLAGSSNLDIGRNAGRLGRATWDEELSYDEPSIQLDRQGEYHRPTISITDQSQPKTKSVWKTDKSSSSSLRRLDADSGIHPSILQKSVI